MTRFAPFSRSRADTLASAPALPPASAPLPRSRAPGAVFEFRRPIGDFFGDVGELASPVGADASRPNGGGSLNAPLATGDPEGERKQTATKIMSRSNRVEGIKRLHPAHGGLFSDLAYYTMSTHPRLVPMLVPPVRWYYKILYFVGSLWYRIDDFCVEFGELDDADATPLARQLWRREFECAAGGVKSREKMEILFSNTYLRTYYFVA